MYQALYRSFRPETFDGILGQEHIVKILKNQINAGTTGHAYLFCGTRGTGKTSTARLLAKGVNCLAPEGGRPCGVCENCMRIKEGTFMDVIEIDAASNNGVENIRELRESVKYPPVVGRCKVYIIDEVHMLSTGAFNALLKTLEEPPENVMFILATTEVQKLPATILSRCLRLDFRRIPETELRKGMRAICSTIGVEIEDSALGLIVASADGSARDGLSLLDQCISGGEQRVNRTDVLALLGTSGEEVFLEMTDYVHTQQVAESLLLLHRVLSDGKDVRQFMKDWIAHYRSLLMTKFIKNPEDLLNMSAENVERIRTQSQRLDIGTINDSILELSRTLADAKWSTQPRILLELAIVKLGLGESTAVFASPKPSPVQSPATVAATKGELSAEVETEARVDAAPKDAVEVGKAAGQSQAMQEFDLDDLWHRIFEDGEVMKGSFNLLRRGTTLVAVGNESFTVQVCNDMMERFAKDNKAEIEGLMERRTGQKRHMLCTFAKENKTENAADQAKTVAESLEHRLGIHIKVE